MVIRKGDDYSEPSETQRGESMNFTIKPGLDINKFRVYIGQRFGMLVVKKKIDRKNEFDHRVMCQCDCNWKIVVYSSELTEKLKRSCGCVRHGAFGMSKTPIHHIWRGMRNMHYKKESKLYINSNTNVCPKWGESFLEFRKDMGDFPGGCQLARINNRGDFTPENCYWKKSPRGRPTTWRSYR